MLATKNHYDRYRTYWFISKEGQDDLGIYQALLCDSPDTPVRKIVVDPAVKIISKYIYEL